MHHDKVADVHVGARLSASTCYDTRTAVRAAFAGHDTVRLWLDDVDYVDASGLGLLVGLHRLAVRFDVTLVCVNPSERLSRVLRECGLTRVLRLQLPVVEDDRRPEEQPA